MNDEDDDESPLPTARIGVLGSPSDAMVTLLWRGSIGHKQRFSFFREPAVTGDARPDGIVLITSVDNGATGAAYDLFRVIESGIGVAAVLIDGCAGLDEMIDDIEHDIREHLEQFDTSGNDLYFARLDSSRYLEGDERWVEATTTFFRDLDDRITAHDLSTLPLILREKGETPLRSLHRRFVSPRRWSNTADVLDGCVLRGRVHKGAVIEVPQPVTLGFHPGKVDALERPLRLPYDPPLLEASAGAYVRTYVRYETQPSDARTPLIERGSLRFISAFRARIRRGWSAGQGFTNTPFREGENLWIDGCPGWFHSWGNIHRLEQHPGGQYVEIHTQLLIDVELGPHAIFWVRGDRCGALATEIDVIG